MDKISAREFAKLIDPEDYYEDDFKFTEIDKFAQESVSEFIRQVNERRDEGTDEGYLLDEIYREMFGLAYEEETTD